MPKYKEKATIATYLEPELQQFLAETAKKEHRSMSKLLNLWIRERYESQRNGEANNE